MKALKYFGIGLAALLALAILVAAIVAMTVDPNSFKPEIVRLVKEKTGRELAIDGGLALAFLPRPGISARSVTISGPGGTGKFAGLGEATVSVALWPLLERRVVLKHIDVRGLRLELATAKDGGTNFDDLAGRGANRAGARATGAPPFAIDIGGVRLDKATIIWRDERKGREIRVVDLDARVGRIAEGASGRLEIAARLEGRTPEFNVAVKGSAAYRLDLAKTVLALEDLDLRVVGDAAGTKTLDAALKGSIEVDATGQVLRIARFTAAASAPGGLDIKASVPGLRLSPDGASGEASSAELRLAGSGRSVAAKIAMSAPASDGRQTRFERIDIEAQVRQGDATLAMMANTRLAIDFAEKTAQLAAFSGELVASGPQVPKKSVKGSVSGGARVAWGTAPGASAEFVAQLEESNLNAKLSVADADPPRIEFDVAADRLDVDRYLPPAPRAARSETARKGAADKGAADAPIDLSGLKGLDAKGSVRIGSLAWRNIKARSVKVGMLAAGDKLVLSPLGATLYEGTFAGSGSVNAATNAFAVRGQLDAIAVGPLLRDAAEIHELEGKGRVAFDLAARGETAAALKRSLQGSARVGLRDGAVKGVDLHAIAKVAGSLIGSASPGESRGTAGGETRFSEFSASFAVKDGVAANDDLKLKSPVIEASGVGRIDIAAESADYLFKVKATGRVAELQALKGVAVPVRITGPLDAPRYSVDVASLAIDAAKSRIGEALGMPKGSPGFDLLDALRGKKR